MRGVGPAGRVFRRLKERGRRIVARRRGDMRRVGARVERRKDCEQLGQHVERSPRLSRAF